MTDPGGMGPEAQDLVDVARRSDMGGDAEVARVRTALRRRLGAAAFGAAAASTLAQTSSAASVASALLRLLPLAAKVVTVTALVGGAAAGSRHFLGAHSAARPPDPVVLAPLAAIPSSEPALDHAPAAPSLRPEPAPRDHAQTRRAVPSSSVRTAPTPAITRTPVSPSRADEFAADVARLREAHMALVAGDPARALAAVDPIDPHGPLAEERGGVQALAGCTMSARDARGRGRVIEESFVRRWPESPLAARVHAVCVTPSSNGRVDDSFKGQPRADTHGESGPTHRESGP